MFQLEIFGAISAMVGIKMLPLVVSLRKITWLNSQQPKTGEHVEHRSNTSFFLQLYDILLSAVRYCKNISTTYINSFSIQSSIPNRDEFEQEFSGSSEPELWRFRAEQSRAGALQFPSWNRADKILTLIINFIKNLQFCAFMIIITFNSDQIQDH
jgi:hypothetical protein